METYGRGNVLLLSDDVKRIAKARRKRSDFIEAFVISRSREEEEFTSRGHAYGSKRRAFLNRQRTLSRRNSMR